jgi:NAD(P)-dependent dehydrogenase (short-subunit alcohol dehydrogenase family)
LVGRVAVVTGAGSGLGAAMARKFAEAGMAAALADELGVPATSVRGAVGSPA